MAGRRLKNKQAAALSRADRRRQIAALRCKRLSQTEIAEIIGVSLGTVNRDLKIVEAEWREEALRSIEEVKSRELADLAEMERDAGVEFDTSAVKYKLRSEDGTAVAVEGPRDPNWLEQRRRIKEHRAKLLGLYAPDRKDVTSAGDKLEFVLDLGTRGGQGDNDGDDGASDDSDG